jgi:hypothetical protein
MNYPLYNDTFDTVGYSEVFWDVVDLVMFLGMLFFNVQDLGMSEIG